MFHKGFLDLWFGELLASLDSSVVFKPICACLLDRLARIDYHGHTGRGIFPDMSNKSPPRPLST